MLFNKEPILQQRYKSEAHIVSTEEINKIPRSSNDNKRRQTFHNITSHPYAQMLVCKTDLLQYVNIS